MSMKKVIKTTINYLIQLKKEQSRTYSKIDTSLQRQHKKIASYEGNDWQSETFQNSLPKHLIFNNRNIFYQKTISNSFN